MQSALEAIFSGSGALAEAVPGFRPRAAQTAMALRVGQAIDVQQTLIAEAGTGTGKTFAYLVPALLSGGKVIISTGTKTLQDQLFNKDLPLVRQALKLPVDAALLKGRANYICPYYLKRAAAEGRFLSPADAAHLAILERFAQITPTGDKAECGQVPEDSSVWPQVTSTRDNCLGNACPEIRHCFVAAARKAALDADVVVVNHHLFFADVMLKEEGTGDLLPAADVVIFDEAHQLPDVASLFFGKSVSTAQVFDWLHDAKVEAIGIAKDFLDLLPMLSRLDKAARDLRLAARLDAGRFPARALLDNPDFMAALGTLGQTLAQAADLLESQAGRSEGLEKAWQRALELKAAFDDWQTESEGFVRWVELYTHTLQLHATPLSIADIFQKQVHAAPKAWIFTSATLSVQKRFDHYQAEMGLIDAACGIWDSPFDYPNQALLYAPKGLPNPNDWGYAEAAVEAAWPAIAAATQRGGVFFLCTSLKAMKKTHELLEEKCLAAGIDAPLFLQGQCGKNELLTRFRAAGNGILIGSQSFWEGVDVPGDALCLVAIDKLPFAPPDDPVLAARIEALRRAGKNPFMDYQLPRAVLSIKQGAGRLIRTESDRGMLIVCDPRMIDKPYGRRVWQSLPPMRRTREATDAAAFFAPEPVS